MGGRGTKLDVDKYLRLPSSQRTAEYESIYYEGNIKFLVQKKGARTAAPIFSNTAGRIYVTINQRGKIVAITKYDEKHEAEFTIHEPHSGEMNEVHMHSSFKTGRKKTSWEHMSQYQKNLYWEIKQKYDAYNISSLMLKWNETHGK